MIEPRWGKSAWLGVAMMLSLACWAEEITVTGEVASIQLLDATQLGGGDRLVLVLTDGRGFELPGKRSVAISPGMRVEVRHVPTSEDGRLALACVVRVLAVPLERGDEETLQEAARPFVVYRNETVDGKC